MKNKIISLIMAILVVASCIPFVLASDDATITVSSATAVPGEEVSLDVEISNNPGINTFALSFDYDATRLELKSVEISEALGGQFAYAKKAVWLNNSDTKYNGKILTAKFKVLENAPVGEAAVAVAYSAGDIANYNEEDVDFKLVAGKITVKKEAVECGKITVFSATAAPGEEVSLDVSISGNPGINTFSLAFNYDATRLELKSVEISEALGGQFAYAKKAVWINNSDTKYNGTILTAKFKVLDDAENGDAAVSVSYSEGEIANYNEEDVDFDLVSGKITVKKNDPNASKMTVSTVKTTAGKQVKVAISLKNNPGITAARLFVDYDSSVLTLKNVENGLVFADTAPMLSPSFDVVPYQMQWSVGVKDTAVNDVLATLTFEVNENAKEGSYPISVTYDEDEIFNTNFENVAFEVENGAVEVISYTPGDVNGDGTVNLKDVALLQQYLSGWSVTIIEAASDTNGDGTVNLKDVALLQQFLSGWSVTLK